MISRLKTHMILLWDMILLGKLSVNGTDFTMGHDQLDDLALYYGI